MPEFPRFLLHPLSRLLISAFLGLSFGIRLSGEPPCLPNEVSAEELLNGFKPWPRKPSKEVLPDRSGMSLGRLGKTPPPGVHPRILTSPEELPELRRRVAETHAGRQVLATLRLKTDAALRKADSPGKAFYDLLSSGDVEKSREWIYANDFPKKLGHYKPWLYALILESLDALIHEDTSKGEAVATALATYAAVVLPVIESAQENPMHDDLWRARTTPAGTGAFSKMMSIIDLVGYNLLGYGYDFAYGFMTPEQRDTVRKTIATVTHGRVWMGVRMPPHFRNWNWIAVGLSQPLLALAIEGEEGYDPRVYEMGCEIAQDYLTWSLTPEGSSTEAVGYTQFGLVWANPFLVAMSRRGNHAIAHPHFRAMLNWYLHSLEPSGDRWTSHGDGGDGGPSRTSLELFRYFFPEDARADCLAHCLMSIAGDSYYNDDFYVVEMLLWATDPDTSAADFRSGESLGQPLSFIDPERGSVNVRSGWNRDAVALQFEARLDSHSASHEHADRGNFTLSAHGRQWAKENFRSVESRFHNGVQIDGKGQGYWAPAASWMKVSQADWGALMCADLKPAYDHFWLKGIVHERPDSPLFQYPRWASYQAEADLVRQHYGDLNWEMDRSPSVAGFWEGFEKHTPRMWDEDSRPFRAPFNPVEFAFRSVAFIRGKTPFVLVSDDIRKDGSERLYEWLMQTGLDTELASIKGNDLILCDSTVKRGPKGESKPARGDRMLLVRVLSASSPAVWRDQVAQPLTRLETFERADTPVAGKRSFGLDKRLVIATRCTSPGFRVLLFPFRQGEPLPETVWKDEHTLSVTASQEVTTFRFQPSVKFGGLNEIVVERGDQKLALE